MTEDAFKEQVVDKLMSLARTIEFDDKYTIKQPYDPSDPYVDQPIEVFLGDKEIFWIVGQKHFHYGEFLIFLHDGIEGKKADTSIGIQEVKGYVGTMEAGLPQTKLFKKTLKLYNLLVDILCKREKAEEKKAKELAKEQERQQKQRLSEQQNATLSDIDSFVHRSK